MPWFLGTTVSDVVEGTPFVFYALITGPLYMLLWPAGLHLALVFPTPTPLVARHRWVIPGLYVVAMAAYVAATLAGRLATSTDLEWVGTWPVAQVAVIVPALMLTLALFVWRYRRAADPATRTRIRWAWLGVIASGSIGLLLFMLPELLLQQTLLPESWIGITAMPLPLGLAAGILRRAPVRHRRRHPPDVRLRRTDARRRGELRGRRLGDHRTRRERSTGSRSRSSRPASPPWSPCRSATACSAA